MITYEFFVTEDDLMMPENIISTINEITSKHGIDIEAAPYEEDQIDGKEKYIITIWEEEDGIN